MSSFNTCDSRATDQGERSTVGHAIDLDNPVNRALMERLDFEEQARFEAHERLVSTDTLNDQAKNRYVAARRRVDDTIRAIALLTDTAVMDCDDYDAVDTSEFMMRELAAFRAAKVPPTPLMVVDGESRPPSEDTLLIIPSRVRQLLAEFDRVEREHIKAKRASEEAQRLSTEMYYARQQIEQRYEELLRDVAAALGYGDMGHTSYSWRVREALAEFRAQQSGQDQKAAPARLVGVR